MSSASRSSKTAGAEGPWLAGLLFAGLAVYYMYLGVHEGVPGIIADDAIYLLMADAWSPYFPELAQSADFVSDHVRFPPLYPAILALSGAGSHQLPAAHAVTVGFLLASFVAFFFWLHAAPGTRGQAMVLVLAFALLPTTQIHALDLWSEHLYLFFSVCALAVSRDCTLRGWMTVALLVSAAALTRTAGIALVAAFVGIVWLTPAPRRIWLTVTALAPLAAWVLIRSSDTAEDQNIAFLFSKYGSADPEATWRLLLGNAQALWHGWRTSFDVVGTNFGLALAVICAALWIAGWSLRIRRLRFDAIYVLFYLAMILVWPNQDHSRRFLFPLIPVALFQCLAFLNRLPAFGTRAAPPPYGIAFAVLLVLAAAPSNAAIGARLFAPMQQEISEFRRTKVWLTHVNANTAAHNLRMLKLAVSSYRIAARYVPAEACVFSVHPEMFMYYARRSSYAPPVPLVPDDEFRNRILRCRFVHLLWMTTHPYLAPGYPGGRIGGGSVLYRAQWKVANGIVTYAELIDMGRGNAFPGRGRPLQGTAVARIRSDNQARRTGAPGSDTDGEPACTAACP